MSRQVSLEEAIADLEEKICLTGDQTFKQYLMWLQELKIRRLTARGIDPTKRKRKKRK